MPSKHSPRHRNNRLSECRECGGHRDEVGSISARGLCETCREAIMRAELTQLKAGEGPWHDHWRQARTAGLRAYVESL